MESSAASINFFDPISYFSRQILFDSRALGEFVLPSCSTHTVRMLCKVVLATVTFLLFFYSATTAMSLMYALDLALLRF